MNAIDMSSPPPSEIAPGLGLLVPVDFSAASARASRIAVSLAQKWAAQVTFVHVLAPLADEAEVLAFGSHFLAQRQTHAEVKLEAWRQTHAADQQAACEILHGRDFEEIVSCAAVRRVEMIIMARSGRSGIIEQLLGSTAERVVRHAKCPVLVINDSDEAPLLEAGPLLLTTDFSPASRCAFPWAERFARTFDAKITLANVQEPMGLPGTREYARFYQQIDALRAQADAQITALRDESLDASLSGDAEVVEGTPHRAICRLARRLKAALIVMSSHGRTGWQRALIGSTAELVVRHAPCAVLVIRGSDLPTNTDPE
jgi:nucleotide-binding universal stress UspA family protein